KIFPISGCAPNFFGLLFIVQNRAIAAAFWYESLNPSLGRFDTSFRETSNFTARSYRTVLPSAALLLEWLAFGEEGFNLVIKHRQRGTDSHVHIQVLIRTQTSAEQNVVLARFRSRELAVLLQHLAVFWSVNGVIRLIALFRRA